MKKIVLLVLVLAGCGKPAPKEETPEAAPTVAVVLANVESRDFQDTLSLDGSLVLPEGATSKLAPSVAGRLVAVRVKEGDCVRAGDLLARIDSRALVAQSQSAESGAESAKASADGTGLSLQAAQADQESAVRAARLALDVAVADAKASVEAAQADVQRVKAPPRAPEIAQAQQAIDAARIAHDKARLDADRDRRLLAEGLVAGSQADASTAALGSAESTVKSAQAALDLLRVGPRPEELRAARERLASARDLGDKKIAQARAALTQAKSGRLTVAAKGQEAVAARLAAQQKAADARSAAASVGAAEMRSPISGIVVRRFLNPGDVADPTTPVLAVAATRSNADFVGSVSPSEATRIVAGMPIRLGNMGGVVASVGTADPATGLVAVRAHLAGPARTGDFATARIVVATLRGVPAVPKGAVLSRDGKDVVFVVRDGVAHMTEVVLGPEEKGLVAVRKGVSPRDKVVVLGGQELSDGAKVEAAKEP